MCVCEREMMCTYIYDTHKGFAVFHLNPLRVQLSFEYVPGIDYRPLHKVLSWTGGLTNIDEAPVKLNALVLRNCFCRRQQFISLISRHYLGQLQGQIYSLLGNLAVLGSPLSLVNNLGTGVYSLTLSLTLCICLCLYVFSFYISFSHTHATGVYDFFHEPAQGLVRSPGDFSMGLYKGTGSLVQHSIYGVFSTTKKIQASLGRGVARMSLDEEYMKARHMQSRVKPRDVGEGFVLGVRDFGSGVCV